MTNEPLLFRIDRWLGNATDLLVNYRLAFGVVAVMVLSIFVPPLIWLFVAATTLYLFLLLMLPIHALTGWLVKRAKTKAAQ